jgi:heptaprenyl diphosphate synthase
MQLCDKQQKNGDFLYKTILLLLAISLNALEFFIPRIPFLPWLKPGLANCITIIWVIRYGTADALVYTILRSWISGFYFGFSFITLILSLSGGLLATFFTGITWKYLGKRNVVGTVGIGVIGATFHNLGQLLAVYFTIARNSGILYQMPFMLVAALISGSIVGVLVKPIIRVLKSISMPEMNSAFSIRHNHIDKKHTLICALLIMTCMALLIIKNIFILLAIAAIITLLSQVFSRFSLKTLLYPLRFWPLFLFIAFVYLFFSYGTRVNYFPAVTHEGIQETIAQIFRLWAWLQTGYLLARFHFHISFFGLLKRIFPGHKETLLAGLLALEYFPEVIRFAKSSKGIGNLNFLKSPLKSTDQFLLRMRTQILLLLEQRENLFHPSTPA